jgi:hypothetical protein
MQHQVGFNRNIPNFIGRNPLNTKKIRVMFTKNNALPLMRIISTKSCINTESNNFIDKGCNL